MMKFEIRHNATEVRATDHNFEGYAAMFYNKDDEQGTCYRLNPNCLERINRAAFERTLTDGHDIKMYGQHRQEEPLGRTGTDKAAKLALWADDRGLRFALAYDGDDPDHRKYRAKLRNGSIYGMSFRFYAAPNKGDRIVNERGQNYRELIDVDLDEVSLVTNPAYTATGASYRSAETDEDFNKRFEDWNATQILISKAEIFLAHHSI